MSRLAVVAWHLGVGVLNLMSLSVVARLTQPPASSEYFLTEHLADAWFANWFWIGPVQVVIGWFGCRYGQVRLWSVLLACVVCYMGPVFVEGWRDPTSRNLIPFELATWAFICSPVAVGALLGALNASRAAPQTLG